MKHFLLLVICVFAVCGKKLEAEDTMEQTSFISGLVSILDLGAKNDGSEDISDIINEYTAQYSLLLPAGIYKVSKPLYLKNPLVGQGYSRVPSVNKNRTWLISAIDCSDASVGVINFSGSSTVNVTDLNILCHSHECGIRICECRQDTATYICRVGIFNMRSYGLYIKGSGSRPIFAEDMTIFSSSDLPVPCVGIYNGSGVCDNRFNNIEMMGIRVGLELHAGFTYGNNFHIWTGCMPQHDNGAWWRGTRGIVCDDGAVFVGSQIYPDTCFYAFEQRSKEGLLDIQNVMYWEDYSTKQCNDKDGAFFHGPEGAAGNLKIIGGNIGVSGFERMKNVYTPGQTIRGVTLRSNVKISAENIDKLCIGDELPDYSLHYEEAGLCKAADILPAAQRGSCELLLTIQDGAVFRITAIGEEQGKHQVTVSPVNLLCKYHEVIVEDSSALIEIYVKNQEGGSLDIRVMAQYMTPYFRPVDYGNLKSSSGGDRAHFVKKDDK